MVTSAPSASETSTTISSAAARSRASAKSSAALEGGGEERRRGRGAVVADGAGEIVAERFRLGPHHGGGALHGPAVRARHDEPADAPGLDAGLLQRLADGGPRQRHVHVLAE